MNDQLWEGDTGTLTFGSRKALVQLLKGPMVNALQHVEVWRAITTDQDALNAVLNNLFLELVLDEDAGVAFTRPANGGQDVLVGNNKTEAMPKVLRTETLSHFDTLIILILRQELTMAPPGERVIVDREEIREQVLLYRVDEERDEAKLAKRFDAAFRRIVDYSLAKKTETPERFEVSPALRQIFDADTVAGVRAEYEKFNEAAHDGNEEEKK
ncbi:hypothetical protein YH66_14040 [[Brevibacterium] flavum]|uniref:DUF4194 domain-containing protein n=1 Tax=[Brevibacterium] flavum TaxID=92706 RepID=A0A0F6WRI9_9CORY|nr:MULTISPECIES: DUF4194 domain-containing protein [Corynebacterium]AJE68401.1 hypothetical protein SB89_13205 [Corynebacterium glutamicum]AKF28563.1 hypothetical protein YH66_14040 [[Brevibacterium] flavum]ANE09399.1 hypothetical protein A3654_14110 [Corynebacterium glutamicum]AST21809.1 DUF4194 domain-containing protein [Corynebacterium glutamicum ATCC 14067]KEI24346.1 hypothetical protein KIQ_001930 [Corynebacterium glutamicum ATCC 14067]